MKSLALTALALASFALAAPIKQACYFDPATNTSHCTVSPPTTIVGGPSSSVADQALEKRQVCGFDPRSHKGQCAGGQHPTVGVSNGNPEWPPELGEKPKDWDKPYRA